MFNNVALDVFIGLIAIFLLYSLFASILMEALAKRLSLRARITQKAISRLLDDSEFTSDSILCRAFGNIFSTRFINNFKGRPLTALFYAHPNIKNLGKNNVNRKPSDISPDLFSETLVQILRGDKFDGGQNQVELITNNLKYNDDSKVLLNLPKWYDKKLWINDISTNQESTEINTLTVYQLHQLLFESHTDINLFKTKLVNWYNEMMNRATGWYIKQTRILLFIIGFILAVSFNIDTISIAKKLSVDKTARDKMVEFAAGLQQNKELEGSLRPKADSALDKTFSLVYKNIQEANTIIGDEPFKVVNFYTIMGWLITAFAISLGAPFWFDLLGKIMSIRQAGKKSESDKTILINSVSVTKRVG